MATRCIAELYRVLGDSIRNNFTELRPAQLEAVESAMAEVNPGILKRGAKGGARGASKEPESQVFILSKEYKKINAL